MSHLDDPSLVAEQYSREDNLRARQSLYEETEGPDPNEVLRARLTELEPRHVLEVGGGPGELAEWMHDHLGTEVAFIDSSARMVELARARGVDAQVGDVQKLPFAGGTFDVAIAAWMLYHVPDIDRGLAELARVLVAGGTLVAVTNSVDHLRELRDLLAYPAGQEEKFNRENGEDLLRPHFAHIERIDVEGTVIVRERAKLVAYRDSMSIEVATVPEAVPMPFIVHARTSIFLASK